MWRLMGQAPVLKELDRSFGEGLQAHAYLLTGPPQVGKGTLAVAMAQAVNCLSSDGSPCGECVQCQRIASGLHADVLVIGVNPDGAGESQRREIGIDDVREAQRQANLKPYEGSSRVFVFDGAERMSEEASNALLKILEEPPPQVMIVLVASHEDALLPTIRSRCRRLELRPMPWTELAKELAEAHDIAQGEAELLARLSGGRPGWVLSAIGDPSIMEERNQEVGRAARLTGATLEEKFGYASELASSHYRSRETASGVLNLWLRWWRDLLLVKEGAEDFVHNLDRIEALKETASGLTTIQVVSAIKAIVATLDALDANANARLALEVLMMSLPGEGTRDHE